MNSISRRSLTRGAAWSIPAIAMSTHVPLYAASRCGNIVVEFGGGFTYNWGTGTVGQNVTTNQKITFGGKIDVKNLPAGVTVKSTRSQFWIQNRIGQNSYGPGAFFLGNSTSNRRTQNRNALPWTPTAGSGFRNTAYNTVNLHNHTFSNGETAPAWDLNMTWEASRDTLSSTYTNGSTSDCKNFTTGSSRHFEVEYTGVRALPSYCPPERSIMLDVHVTVELSTGEILKYYSSTNTLRNDVNSQC